MLRGGGWIVTSVTRTSMLAVRALRLPLLGTATVMEPSAGAMDSASSMLAQPSLSSGTSLRLVHARIRYFARSSFACVKNSKKSDSRSATVMTGTPAGARSTVSRSATSHFELSFSSGARQIAQFLDRCRRYEARANEPMGQ